MKIWLYLSTILGFRSCIEDGSTMKLEKEMSLRLSNSSVDICPLFDILWSWTSLSSVLEQDFHLDAAIVL